MSGTLIDWLTDWLNNGKFLFLPWYWVLFVNWSLSLYLSLWLFFSTFYVLINRFEQSTVQTRNTYQFCCFKIKYCASKRSIGYFLFILSARKRRKRARRSKRERENIFCKSRMNSANQSGIWLVLIAGVRTNVQCITRWCYSLNDSTALIPVSNTFTSILFFNYVMCSNFYFSLDLIVSQSIFVWKNMDTKK